MNDTIRKQIMAVRATGETNMLDTRMGFYELVIYLEYANFILTGNAGEEKS